MGYGPLATGTVAIFLLTRVSVSTGYAGFVPTLALLGVAIRLSTLAERRVRGTGATGPFGTFLISFRTDGGASRRARPRAGREIIRT